MRAQFVTPTRVELPLVYVVAGVLVVCDTDDVAR